VLEGGEERVQFGEVAALRGFLALDGLDDGGEFLLEGKRGERHHQISEYFQVNVLLSGLWCSLFKHFLEK